MTISFARARRAVPRALPGARRATIALCTLAAAATVLLLAAAFLPTLAGVRALIVTGTSMGEGVPVGSVAHTERVDARSVAVGDVVSFHREGRRIPVTHRVIEARRRGSSVVLRTKGDASGAPDPEPVVVEGEIDRVVRAVPGAGWVVAFARSPWGLALFLAGPALGLAVDARRRAT